MNHVTLIGRVGKDPESRQTENFKVTTFSLATTEHFTKDGEKKEKTEWHNIVCFSNTATIAEKYVHKGDQLAVEGKIQTRSWDDKDGNKRYTTEIVVTNLELIGGKKSEAEPPASNMYERTGVYDEAPKEKASQPVESDDLPF